MHQIHSEWIHLEWPTADKLRQHLINLKDCEIHLEDSRLFTYEWPLSKTVEADKQIYSLKKWIKDEQQNDHPQTRFHYIVLFKMPQFRNVLGSNEKMGINFISKTIWIMQITHKKIYSGCFGTEFRSFSVHQNIYSTSFHSGTPLWLTFILRRDATWNVDILNMLYFIVISLMVFFYERFSPHRWLFLLTTTKVNCTNCICLMSIDYIAYNDIQFGKWKCGMNTNPRKLYA